MTQVITPPNSKENEMIVLGCALTSLSALEQVCLLAPNDFYFVEHKTIFFVLKKLSEKDKPADIHLVAEELKSRGKLNEAGGISYLTTLAQYAATSAYIDEYIALLKEDSAKRKLLELSQNAQKAALNESSDV